MLFLGVDEVGRGPLAGPIVAAAVLLDTEAPADFTYVADSKKVTPRRREIAFHSILRSRHLRNVGVGYLSAREIDAWGIDDANRIVMARAGIAALGGCSEPVELVVDGTLQLHPKDDRALRGLGVRSIRYQPQADALVPAVSAASIIAKVLRDRHMAELAREDARWGWGSNSGYGSPAHMQALQHFGPTAQHRATFIEKILAKRR